VLIAAVKNDQALLSGRSCAKIRVYACTMSILDATGINETRTEERNVEYACWLAKEAISVISGNARVINQYAVAYKTKGKRCSSAWVALLSRGELRRR
jgi:hypothetical protein